MKKDFDIIDRIVRFFGGIGLKKLSPEQIALIDADVVIVNERCKKIADARNESEDKWQKNSDEKCPNCDAKKDSIVNKIRQVQGSGSGNVGGNLFGVYGSSSISIDTASVNHCNSCGNEWKKFKKDFKSTREVVQDGIKYTARLIQDPVEYKWAKDFARIFDGCYVETILRFAKENEYSLYTDDKETLCFTTLQNYFKSVWDDPNIKRELKIYLNND